MRKYTVSITETLCKSVSIIADSFDDAFTQAEDQYNNNRISLTPSDFVESTIDVLGFEEESIYLIRICEPDNKCKNLFKFGSEEVINDFIKTLDTAPIEVLIVPDDALVYGKEYRLNDYETVYDFEPDWASEHQYLWLK